MGIKDYKTDKDLEKNGVWVEFNGFKVLVARTTPRSTPKFFEALENLNKNRRGKNSSLSNEQVYELFAEHVIKGWQTEVNGKYVDGIEDVYADTQKILPATPKNIFAVLREVPDLAGEIADMCQNMEYYRNADMEDNAKNS